MKKHSIMIEKKINTKFTSACLLLCLSLFSASCTSEEEKYGKDVPMKIAFTRVDEVSGNESAPLLLFWKEEDFKKGSLNTPYKTSIPGGKIDNYTDVPYDTEEKYPIDNSTVIGMGIFPSNMTMDANYESYSLSSGKAGLTDVLVTPIGVEGNMTHPFKNKLIFEHAAVQIVLKARRMSSTVGKLYIKNLRLTVPSSLVCGGVLWSKSEKKYKANKATEDLVISYPEQILSTEDNDVAVLYLLPCQTNKLSGLKLTATIAKDMDFKVGVKENVNFPISDGNLNFLNAAGNKVTQFKTGESYETTLLFNYDSITMEGEEMEWEDGGKIIVSVVIPEKEW